MGGGDIPVRLLEGEMQVGVLHRELRLLLPTALVLEFRVEVGVETKLVVENSCNKAVAHPARSPSGIGVRPILDGHRSIGHEPFALSCSAARAQPSARMIFDSVSITKDEHPGVAAIKAVTEMLEALGHHTTPAIQSIDAQSNQLMLPCSARR